MSFSRHGPPASPACDVDPVEVGAVALRDQVELVRDREVDVAVGVREELRELGLDGAERDDPDTERPEEFGGPLGPLRHHAGDDLRQREQVVEREALRDPFRTVGDVDGEVPLLQPAAEPIRDARKHRVPDRAVIRAMWLRRSGERGVGGARPRGLIGGLNSAASARRRLGYRGHRLS